MIPAWVSGYLNIPYKPKGRDKFGFDCWGIAHYIYRHELGIIVPDYVDVAPNPCDRDVVPSEMRKGLDSDFERVTLPKEFDLVCFNIYGKLMHCGVMINNHQFVHASDGLPSGIERLGTICWKSRIEGFYRYV